MPDKIKLTPFLVQMLADAEHLPPPNHGHCECRTPGCGHIDLRHAKGRCSYPGCKCQGWS